MQHRNTLRLESENARLREMTFELETLRGENSRLAKAQIDPAELQRLRAGQSELARLRGEVSQLRRDILSAKRAGSTNGASTAPRPGSEPVSPVDSYVANVRAAVPWSQTLV